MKHFCYILVILFIGCNLSKKNKVNDGVIESNPISCLCDSNSKFLSIEADSVINILEKNTNTILSINYSLQQCSLLKNEDSLRLYEYKIIPKSKKYNTIEDLICGLNKNLVNGISNYPGVNEITFPVLKYENKVFVEISSDLGGCGYVIELKNSQEIVRRLIYEFIN